MTYILIVGSNADGALERWYAAAFRSLGVKVDIFDPERSIAAFFHGRITGRLARPIVHLPVAREMSSFFAGAPNYDIVFVVKGLFIPARAIAQAKQRMPSAHWVCFDPDSPFAPGWSTSSRHIRQSIPLYDQYFIWSRTLVSQMEANGSPGQIRYLPFGFDETDHFPAIERDPSLAAVITFVGTYDRQRAHLLHSIADLPLRIFGFGWDRLPIWSPLRSKIGGSALFGAELRRIVTSSLASINVLRSQNAGSHNMRTFEVPAMGGLMVTTRSAEQHEFFPEGKACLMYSDARELRELLSRLLRGEVDVEALRNDALRCVRPHSYRARASAILDAIR